MAIIATLIGLLLPAIQKVRDAASRMSCQNNLRQMGIALANFSASKNKFPAALINPGRVPAAFVASALPYQGPEGNYPLPGAVGYVYNHTGFVALLPFLEQDNLYKQYSYANPSSLSSISPLVPAGPDTPNALVMGTNIKIFNCPADDSPAGLDAPVTTPLLYEHLNARRSNYLFSVGAVVDGQPVTISSSLVPQSPLWSSTNFSLGAFGLNGSASLSTIKDGTSNTIAIGETKQAHVDAGAGPFWACGTYGSVLGSLPPTDPTYNINAQVGVCPGQATGVSNCQNVGGFGSWHAGGASFVYCDGSVHFLSDTISYPILVALSTYKGGEAVQSPD
jgi:prepilin-type processing-associated H-X9-DG protein